MGMLATANHAGETAPAGIVIVNCWNVPEMVAWLKYRHPCAHGSPGDKESQHLVIPAASDEGQHTGWRFGRSEGPTAEAQQQPDDDEKRELHLYCLWAH